MWSNAYTASGQAMMEKMTKAATPGPQHEMLKKLSGDWINWIGTMSDPMTGKPSRNRMVTTIVDDNHHTLAMYSMPPGAKKEMKTMTIEYTRK